MNDADTPLTALEWRDRIVAGKISAVLALDEFLEALDAVDRRTAALSETFPETARAAAEAVDARLAAGESPRALEGVPFTAKSNIATREGRTHAGSRMLEQHRAPEDATAVRRMRAAGAILVGKTHCDEFAMGSSTENSAFGPVRNPWNLERVPGGSSGGAAALAGSIAGGVHLGSDTGGSIRQPAAYCGCTGLKPTYGTVSRSGLVAFGSSLDQIGPLTRSADDAAVCWSVLAGSDALDATTSSLRTPDDRRVEVPRRVGVPREYWSDAIEPATRAAAEAALETLRADGVETVEVELPTTPYANACYQVISTAEASANLARYDGVHVGRRAHAPADLAELHERSRAEGFGAEVRRRILLGTFVLSSGYQEAYYRRAARVRRKIAEDFERVFETVDVLLSPTAPFPAFGIGDRVTDPLALYACDILTVGASLAGIPALSVPGGLDDSGLPIGIQFIGPYGEDRSILALASRFQELTNHHRILPERGDA